MQAPISVAAAQVDSPQIPPSAAQSDEPDVFPSSTHRGWHWLGIELNGYQPDGKNRLGGWRIPSDAAAHWGDLSIGVMHQLKCIHPPGGASALTAVLGGKAHPQIPAIGRVARNKFGGPMDSPDHFAAEREDPRVALGGFCFGDVTIADVHLGETGPS